MPEDQSPEAVIQALHKLQINVIGLLVEKGIFTNNDVAQIFNRSISDAAHLEGGAEVMEVLYAMAGQPLRTVKLDG